MDVIFQKNITIDAKNVTLLIATFIVANINVENKVSKARKAKELPSQSSYPTKQNNKYTNTSLLQSSNLIVVWDGLLAQLNLKFIVNC